MATRTNADPAVSAEIQANRSADRAMVDAAQRAGVERGGPVTTQGTPARPVGSTAEQLDAVIASTLPSEEQAQEAAEQEQFLDELITPARYGKGSAVQDEITGEPELEPEEEPSYDTQLGEDDPWRAYLEDEVEAEAADELEDEDDEFDGPAAPTRQSDQWEDFASQDESEALVDARKRAAKAEKRAKFLEQQNLKRDREDWLGKATDRFPAVPEAMAKLIAERAGSTREFVREMAKMNEMNAGHFARSQKETTAAVREQLKDQWGPPIAGPGVTPGASELEEAKLRQATARGGLGGRFAEKIRQKGGL